MLNHYERLTTYPWSATNITYLLVSLFILYVGIILYVDGDYLYNKVKDFTLRRCGLKMLQNRKIPTNVSPHRVERAKEHGEAVAVGERSELLDGHADLGLGRDEGQLWG